MVPGTKTALVELAVALAERESTVLLPDPGYPDYPPGRWQRSSSRCGSSRPPAGRRHGRRPSGRRLGRVPQLPVKSLRRRRAAGVFESAVRFAQETGAAIVHDFAYGDLMFDGGSPESFLATAGAKEVGVEMFSMSKTYGMAGWRLGFVLGNAEIVGRVDLLQDHARAGILPPSRRPESQRSPGPRLRAGTGRPVRGAERPRGRGAPQHGSAAHLGRLHAWLELPDGVTVDRLLAEGAVALAPGEGLPLVPAGRGCRSR